VQNIINTQDRLIKRDAEIVEARLNGATYDDLARRYEISNSSISHILNKREVKDVLDTALNHLVSFAPIVVRNYRTLLESKDARVRQKATDAMAKILGLHLHTHPRRLTRYSCRTTVLRSSVTRCVRL